MLSEDFTLYRGASGTPHVVAQRCPHRGTQLSVGFVEDDCIRCLYHGWKFAADGACTEMPAETSEFAAKVRIASYPTRTYLVSSSRTSATVKSKRSVPMQQSWRSPANSSTAKSAWS